MMTSPYPITYEEACKLLGLSSRKKHTAQEIQQAYLGQVNHWSTKRSTAIRDEAVTRTSKALREAARVLGCHPKTVQRYAMQGRLRQIHISSRRVRYDMNEVEVLATRGVSQTPK